jgi:lycopene cyclase domain-containing protein
MEYLIILLIILVVTIFVEFKYNIRLYHSRKERLIVTLNIFIVGIIWDYFAIYRQNWIFPGNGLVGLRIFGLPIEEFLFFLIVPYGAFVM